MTGRSLLTGGGSTPMVSSTFGGGPLRWAWRGGDDKVVIRTAAQPGLGEVARSAMLEGVPLPSGGFHFDLLADPGELTPADVPERLLPAVGGAFSSTAGRMVPGIQLMLWGRRGPVAGVFELAGDVEVVQAWSTAGMAVHPNGERLEITCDEAFPLCAVGARVDPRPGTIVFGGGFVAEQETIPVDHLRPPDGEVHPGAHFWWNEERAVVVEGYDETMERLRALGYIE
jgi:hypothetical protein